jgi:hypothetical protein
VKSVVSALVPLVVGFLLTTVVGGLLGVYLQRRSWSHQYNVQLAAARRDRAVALFEELSRLLDRRLYRMRRLYWTIRRERERPLSERGAKSLEDYDAVLFEWNDNINRNLALLERSFGSRMRERLDNEIGATMRSVGVALENELKNPSASETDLNEIDSRLDRLANLIYAYNIEMLASIQGGTFDAARGPATSMTKQG